MYLKGNMFDIFWRNCGKNGIGTTIPERISLITIKILVIPVSFIVNKVMTWYKVITAVISRTPSINVIANNTNDSIEFGNDKQNGRGNNNANMVTGRTLKQALASLVDMIFEYHIL